MKFTTALGSAQINTSLNINELLFVTNCYANNTCVRIYNFIYFKIKYMNINNKKPSTMKWVNQLRHMPQYY